MKKPVEAIERVRNLLSNFNDGIEITAYLDSIPPDAVPVVWPAHLTRERLERLSSDPLGAPDQSRALHALAAIAPKREKRKVALWRVGKGVLRDLALDSRPPGSWTRVGEGEIEE